MAKKESMYDVTVSVIIPIYNAERHLEECLHSCLEQTLERTEIICINDGSTDSSADILESYRTTYANIVILNQKNQGAGIARNLGIEYANGEYIAFMDSDDYYPNKNVLKKLYDTAVEKKVFICGGSLVPLGNETDKRYTFQSDEMMCYRDFQKTAAFQQFLYEARFLKEKKITFPPYRRYQDPPFFVAAMVEANQFYAISERVYMSRNTDKFVPYGNANILLGVLNGIWDILVISKRNCLEKLHADMVTKLMEEYIAYVYKLIYNKNEDARKCYEKVMSGIDETLLAQDGRNVKKPKLLSDYEIDGIIDQSLKREKELLDRINSYESVLIYGAGRAGRMFYHYLLQRKCSVEIDFMVSAKTSNDTAFGKTVKSISECVGKKDNALVIIVNRYHIKPMEETARQYQFQNIEVVSFDELQFFGADMMQEETLKIF